MNDAPLWEPQPPDRRGGPLTEFLTWLQQHHGVQFASYHDAWQWSVDELAAFWADVWSWYGVGTRPDDSTVLPSMEMPGTTWFDGARLNYAEVALRRTGPQPAVIARSQTRQRVCWSRDELIRQVGAVRAGLRRVGVGRGDRVVAYLPNLPETVAAFLATASLGATFSTCAPEFGVNAVLDRFGQIEPTVLLAVDGYRYGTKPIDRQDEVAKIRAGLPTVRTTVVLPYLHPDRPVPDGAVAWADFVAEDGPFNAEPVPFDHPLYVLYSSGTTGLPKPIVHGHGGITIAHLKDLGLMTELAEGDRFFWFTTTGWMMWNYLMSGLLVGATIVLFDGEPASPGLDNLWRLASEEAISVFGVSAPFLHTCMKAGLRPAEDVDLGALRVVGSTGAPLSADGFRWVYTSVSANVVLSPISGGTDVCSAFVGGCSHVPVYAGEIPCKSLGNAVYAFDESGREIVGQQGELVVTKPLPSMPVGFWGDPDGSRYRAAYFEHFPGIWRHGDWVTFNERGGSVISGRSDATLNRGGVRIGTAEIYRTVEVLDDVADSLIVHLEDPAGEGLGSLVLFVTLARGAVLDDTAPRIRSALRTSLSPRHVPDEIHEIPEIPTTLSGKKLEVPVKRILRGADPDTVCSRGALRSPASIDAVAEVARSR